MIEAYSFGRIVIDGQVYSSDVIIYPDHIDSSWWRKEGHRLCVEDLVDIVAAKPEVLIIGCGASGILKVPHQTKEYLKTLGISLLDLPTEAACQQYNKSYKHKKVVAGLHLTC